MTNLHVRWHSELLGRDTEFRVLIPAHGAPPFATLYLLHSLGDNSSAWLEKSCLTRAVQSLPLLVVMPDGQRGFFTNNDDGPPYARHIGEELVPLIDRMFRTIPERHARAIGGASMGGYGALRVGLEYSSLFCSVHSQAGSLDRNIVFARDPEKRSPVIRSRPESFIDEMRRVFGEAPTNTPHDVLYQALEARRRGTLPAFRFDCGTEDYLIHGNRAFHKDLVTSGIPHVYHEYPGSHGWSYCDAHFPEALHFHCQNLGITAPQPASSS